jgi:hypothetical protein
MKPCKLIRALAYSFALGAILSVVTTASAANVIARESR